MRASGGPLGELVNEEGPYQWSVSSTRSAGYDSDAFHGSIVAQVSPATCLRLWFRHEATSAYTVVNSRQGTKTMGIFTVRVRGRARRALTTERASA
jgi:hypothetical protein